MMRTEARRFQTTILLAAATVSVAVLGCIIHDSGAGAGSSSVGANQLPASALKPLRQAGAAAHKRIGTAS